MNSYLKSNTIQAAALLTITQLPQIGDPIWQVAADAGLPLKYLAMAKLGTFVLGILGVVWGRRKAKGPLK